MIKNIKSINNELLFSEYNKMISEMYEHVYKFSPGLKLGFKPKKISLVDHRTFNFFGMYSKNIHSLYREISDMTKSLCAESNINFERNCFYLLGNIVKNEILPINTYINFAPNYKTTFMGLYIINSNNDTMSIDDKILDLEAGQLIMLDSGSKILFKDISDDLVMLSFNISPIEYLYKQYYQKWIPIL
jgi:hypothetical protein